jgi:hypothetical protein
VDGRGVQPILFQVQSILIRESVVKRAGLVVQHKIALLMTLERSKVLRILCPLRFNLNLEAGGQSCMVLAAHRMGIGRKKAAINRAQSRRFAMAGPH